MTIKTIFESNKIITLFVIPVMMVINIADNPLMAQTEKYKINWRIAGCLPDANEQEKQPGVAGPVTGILNNILIVAGGANFPDGMPWNGAKKVYQDEIYLFHKKEGQMKGVLSTQRLPRSIAYPANVVIPQGLIYLGGENENGISNEVVMLKYVGKSNELIFTQLQHLPLPLTNLAATILNNTIYVAGGESLNGPSKQFFSLNLSLPNAQWETLPEIPQPVSHTVLIAQEDGIRKGIYLIGGRAKGENGISEIYNTTFWFDVNNGQWKIKKPLPYQVSAASGIAIAPNYIMICSGDKAEVFSKVETLNVAIEKEHNLQKKQVLVNEKIMLLSKHPGFSKDVLLYNTVKDNWLKMGLISFEPPVTTTLIKWGNTLVLPSGETRAGVRTPLILEGKTNFKIK